VSVDFSGLSSLIDRWHDFFILSGTAAVTLMGLLFVALSLHVDVIVHEDGVHLNAVAVEAFTNLLSVLFLSLLLLAPTSVGRPFGVGLVMLGSLRLMFMLRRVRVIATGGHADLRRNFSIFRVFAPGIAHVLLVVIGVRFLMRRVDEDTMSFFVPALILMMAVATRGAWDLIMLIGRFKLERGRRAGS
jgi:hypothetical protein